VLDLVDDTHGCGLNGELDQGQREIRVRTCYNQFEDGIPGIHTSGRTMRSRLRNPPNNQTNHSQADSGTRRLLLRVTLRSNHWRSPHASLPAGRTVRLRHLVYVTGSTTPRPAPIVEYMPCMDPSCRLSYRAVNAQVFLLSHGFEMRTSTLEAVFRYLTPSSAERKLCKLLRDRRAARWLAACRLGWRGRAAVLGIYYPGMRPLWEISHYGALI
jgi:hypothetical protein